MSLEIQAVQPRRAAPKVANLQALIGYEPNRLSLCFQGIFSVYRNLPQAPEIQKLLLL